MKIFLLLILSIIPFFSKAQSSIYHPFPDSNATWCCGKGYNTGCCFCGYSDYEFHSTYQLNGHALINGTIYNRLLHYEIQYDHCNPDTTIDTTTIYIRQDSSSKIIWMYNSISNSDTVLYDFNLQIGDTLTAAKVFWAGLINPPDFWIVSNIDSVIINGQFRKRFNYYPNYSSTCTSSMIEGIGSIHGLMYAPSNCFEYGAVLRKFYQDNQFQFGDSSPTWYACHDFTTNLIEIPITHFVKLFPNPFHTSALLQFDGVVTNAELKIYNSFGQQIMNQTKIHNSVIINRNDLDNGIYFYRVTNSNGQIMIGKFLIE